MLIGFYNYFVVRAKDLVVLENVKLQQSLLIHQKNRDLFIFLPGSKLQLATRLRNQMVVPLIPIFQHACSGNSLGLLRNTLQISVAFSCYNSHPVH